MNKKNSSKISILVISYNTCDLTVRALHSVFTETKLPNYEIIVFDNASDVASVDTIKKQFGEKVTLIASEKNVGFAKGNNIAATYASGDFLLLLNPDTIVQDHAIDKLFNFAQSRPNAMMWGGRTVFEDQSLNKGSCWSAQSLWSLTSQALGLNSIFRNTTLFNPEGLGGWNREGVREVDIISGCFLLITRRLWDQLKGFDPLFFMYGEDADLCLRAKKLGASPMISGEATIVHIGGASEKTNSGKLIKLLKSKHMLIKIHFGRGQAKIGCFLLSLWPFSRFLAHTLLNIVSSNSERLNQWRDVWMRRNEWL